MIAPIAVATVKGKCLRMMMMSVREYASEVPIYLRGPESVIGPHDADHQIHGQPSTFGECYNEVIDRVFADGFDSVVVANDDIVLTPTSYQVLMDDVALLKKECPKLGWVAARCDASRATQNIRSNPFGEELYYFKHPWEEHIMPMECPSPIFAWISREAWEVAKFPPLNWYSDDVHCTDLLAAGFQHYLSRSYVHHVGSQTIGLDGAKLIQQATPWLRKNRPEYAKQWFDTQPG